MILGVDKRAHRSVVGKKCAFLTAAEIQSQSHSFHAHASLKVRRGALEPCLLKWTFWIRGLMPDIPTIDATLPLPLLVSLPSPSLVEASSIPLTLSFGRLLNANRNTMKLLKLLLLLSSGATALTAPSQTNPALSQITPPPPNPYAHAILGGGTRTTNPNTPWLDGELKKRQQQQIQVCGYINGQSAYPYYCEAGAVCSTDGSLNWAGCCPTGVGVACPIPTSCVPYESIAFCGMGCADNPHMLLW